MELVGRVGEVISFLVGATGVGDLVVLVGVMLVGVGANAVWMIGTTWMGVDKVVDVDDLTIEEMFLTKVEAEVIAAALKEFEHGIIAEVAAEAVAEVGAEAGVAGVGAGVAVEAAAGLVVVVAAIAVVLVPVAVAAAVVAVVEVTVVAAVAVPVMVGVIGQINNFLIKRILGHRK